MPYATTYGWRFADRSRSNRFPVVKGIHCVAQFCPWVRETYFYAVTFCYTRMREMKSPFDRYV